MIRIKFKLKNLDTRFVFVVLFMIIGVAALIYSQAASPTAHFEAESGTRTVTAPTGFRSPGLYTGEVTNFLNISGNSFEDGNPG